MEHLEGETLAHRLTRGALPLDHALRCAIEIADALDKAHRQGIVHRDLKPGNIMLTKSGTKLLDFGLAKLTRPSAVASFSTLPTQDSPMTTAGSLLGTPQYMAPEQLEGKEADARTDIFAFGSVVYEMVTGKKAFQGQSQASLIAAILEHEPPALSTTHVAAPRQLEHVVRRCLAKSPEERWQTASDLHRELKWAAESTGQDASRENAEFRRAALWRRPIVFGVVTAMALLAAAIAGVVVGTLARTTPAAGSRVGRLMLLPPGEPVGRPWRPDGVAISPAGTHVAYVAMSGDRQLYLRAIDSVEAKALPGTESAYSPFFSPDGMWIGFFAQGKLKKVSLAAGTTQTLSDAPLAGRAGAGRRTAAFTTRRPAVPVC